MEYNKDVLEQSIYVGDRGILDLMLPEAWELIATNPFAEKMFYLLAHQELGVTPVINRKNRNSAPNCIGTAFFIAGLSSLGYPYHGYSFELDLHMKINGREPSWDDIMFKHYDRRIPGAFVFSYSVTQDGWHAGIYLGEANGRHLAFAQHGHGEKFGPEIIDRNFSDPDYYYPSTLQRL